MVKSGMSIAVRDKARADFKAYWEAADKARLENPSSLRPLISAAHSFAVAFALFSRAVSNSSPEEFERIFLQELSSDALHLVHVLMVGDARGARFYLRSIIENFWRHHYFRTHPVEYEWLTTRPKFHLEMKTLREYCGWLAYFKGRLRGPCEDLSRLYSELSTSVHSTSAKTLVLRETLEEIRLTNEQAESVATEMRSTLRACLVLLLISESSTYEGLHIDAQKFLRSVLTVKMCQWLDADIASFSVNAT